MIYPRLRQGERGASILAALVLVALLGGVGLAVNSSPSTPPGLQMALPTPVAPQSQVATAVLSVTEPWQEKGPGSCADAIKDAAAAGAETQPALYKYDVNFPAKDVCFAALRKDPNKPATHNESDYDCFGERVQQLYVASLEQIWEKTTPDRALGKGICKVRGCKPEGDDWRCADATVTQVNNQQISNYIDLGPDLAQTQYLKDVGSSFDESGFTAFTVDGPTDQVQLTTLPAGDTISDIQAGDMANLDQLAFSDPDAEPARHIDPELVAEVQKEEAVQDQKPTDEDDVVQANYYGQTGQPRCTYGGCDCDGDGKAMWEGYTSLSQCPSGTRAALQQDQAAVQDLCKTRDPGTGECTDATPTRRVVPGGECSSGERCLNLRPSTPVETPQTETKPYCTESGCFGRPRASEVDAWIAEKYECKEIPNTGDFDCVLSRTTSNPNPNPNPSPGSGDTRGLGQGQGQGQGQGMGGLQQMLGSLMRALGMGNNGLFGQQQPQQLACTSDPNQYNQQVQQYQYQLQQYNYQMQQWQYQQQYGYQSNYTGFGAPRPVPPPQPCYQSSQYDNQYGSQYGSTYGTSGQLCYQSPVQPDPSQCASGSWRPTYTNGCTTGWQCVPSSGSGFQPTAQISCQPQVADVGMTVTLSYACGNATSATGSGFDTGGALTGNATATITTPPPGTSSATFRLACGNQGVTSNAQCSVQVGKPAITVVAIPKTIESGKNSSIGWVTSGMSACVISSPQLPEFTAQNAGNTSTNGVATTPNLTSAAQFILHCATVGGGTRDVTIAIHINGVNDTLTDSTGGSGISDDDEGFGGGGEGSGGGSGDDEEELLAMVIQTTADAKTVSRETAVTITWESLNFATTTRVALWLIDKRTDQATAIIASKQPITGSYTWTIPAANSACPTQGRNVCGSDLVGGRQYAIQAAAYIPEDAYTGDGEPPSLIFTAPLYGPYVTSNPFTLAQ